MKIGVAGCGHWGKNHVRSLLGLGVLAAVADPTEQGRAAARALIVGAAGSTRAAANPELLDLPRAAGKGATPTELLGKGRAASPELLTHEELLRDRAASAGLDVPVLSCFEELLALDLDGVVIATPAPTHYELATKALLAGKDVLIEKPLALTYQEGLQLCILAERTKRMLMVGHVLEYHPLFVELLARVRSGSLGDVRHIYSNRLSLGQVRREENVLWSFAPHDLSMILSLQGREPERIRATGSCTLQPGIEDLVQIQMDFGSTSAHILVSWLNPVKEQRLVVVGTQAIALLDGVASTLTIQPVGLHPTQGLIKGAIEVVDYDGPGPLLLELQAFVASIHSRKPAPTNGFQSLPVVGLLTDAQSSLSTGDWVNLQAELLAI